jgi:(2Fe-2S) ferredoxin
MVLGIDLLREQAVSHMSMDAFLQTLGPERLRAIGNAVRLAHADYDDGYSPAKKVVLNVTPACVAFIRHCHMIDRATRLEAKYATIKPFDSDGLKGIVVDGTMAFIFKKLDENLRPQNNETQHIDDYLSQAELVGIDASHHFVAGYTENRMTGELADVFVVYPAGHGQHWSIRLTAGDAASIVSDMFASDESVEESELHARRESAEVIPLKREDDGNK